MLQRQVYIFANLILARDNVNKLVGNAVGITVQYSDPVKLPDFAKAAQKLGEHELAVDVLAVARGVLSDDVQLPDTAVGELPRLGEDILHGAAAESAADKRDRAVGTAVVAAVRYLYVSGVFRCGLNSSAAEGQLHFVGEELGFLAVERVEHHVGDICVRADADSGVYLVKLFGDLVLIPLRKAAGDDDRLDLALALERAELNDLVDALLLGGFDKAAGVDNDRVSVGGIVHDSETAFLEIVEKHLGVNLVFRAAERYNACLVIHMRQSLDIFLWVVVSRNFGSLRSGLIVDIN